MFDLAQDPVLQLSGSLVRDGEGDDFARGWIGPGRATLSRLIRGNEGHGVMALPGAGHPGQRPQSESASRPTLLVSPLRRLA